MVEFELPKAVLSAVATSALYGQRTTCDVIGT